MPKRKSDVNSQDELAETKSAATTKKPKYAPTDEFQQVTKPSFVDRFRIKDLAYGDALYQPDVGSNSYIVTLSDGSL